MGATYTRQSTYADGDTITADHTNDEFDQLLAAFAASTGHTHDGTAGEGGPISSFGSHAITFGSGTSGTDVVVTFDGEGSDGIVKWMEEEDYFEFSDDILIATTEKIQFRDTAIFINSSANGQLDIVADTEIQIAATTIDINGNVDISGTLTVAGTAITSTAAELNILDGVTSTAAELNILDGVTSTAAELNILDGVTSTTAELNILDGVTSTAAELNILDGVTSTTAELNILDGVTSTTAELNILDGVTSTAAEINILDVSNSTIGDLSEISTAANDDVLIALDTSGGGIKKITRSTFLAGSGSSSDIANVVEDTSPQLGGNLDMNGKDIVTTSNATLDLAPNGTGTVVVRGNTNSAAIVFNCESNSHGQKVFGQPHSASVTNTLMLPAGANSTLVSLVSEDTLTNKTLTSPKINENVAVTSTATELNILDGVTSTTAELNALDGITAVVGELNALDIGSTAVGTAVASKAVILDSNKDYTGIRNLTITGELDAATLDISGAVDVAGAGLVTGILTTTAAQVINGGATVATNKKLIFRDSAIHISSVNDGDLMIVADDEIDITSTLIDINGNVEISGTTTQTGVITANAGVVVDEMTLDADTLTASDDFIIDAAGDITFDAAGDDIKLLSAGTHEGNINLASSNLTFKSIVSDKDMIFQGNDGGSAITALTLDMSAAGAAIFNNDVTAFSDERLKSDITTIPNALSKVTKMRGVHYIRDATGKDSTGVIAQEMQKVAPELVLTSDDKMGTLSVNYGNITGYLIEAIKELKAEIEELKAAQ